MTRPTPSAVLELLKPITWFAPMWAYLCGIVSSGLSITENWAVIGLGVLLAGPMVCGTSQAVNDWFDRDVDRINEPKRPIPSGRIPGRWGLYIAIAWTALSLIVATGLGTWGFIAACVGLALAWAYSAPPLRLKKSGWWGPAAVAVCYEGLPWFTGAAIMAAALPDARILWLALLYSIGAHGIMTLNDFKAVDGDRAMGVRSLPVQLGVERAAFVACVVMALPQIVVVGLLLHWGLTITAALIALSLTIQIQLMGHWMTKPKDLAPWYNATGVSAYVLGMLACAIGLRLAYTAGGPLA
ncbi:MAG: chlorophyll synthase ChlG [Rhodothalassiaceae bacterium]